MADEFEFFSNDSNNWNYNPYINTPNADPYNLKRTINITGNNSYNMMKYNTVIILKEIYILSITTNLFFYYLFRTDETINYKKFCLCSEKIPYI